MPNSGRNSKGPTIHEIAEQNIPIHPLMWPTPTCNMVSGGPNHDSPSVIQGKHGLNLAGAVKMWPTPTSLAPAKNGYNEAGNSCGLVAIKQRIHSEDPTATGQLNPQWVEWLMGFPLGWTDLGGSETQSSRKSQSGSEDV